MMLDDEQHFVVMRRIADRLLRRQQGVQLQVAAIGQAITQVDFDALFEFASVFHGSCDFREERNPASYPSRSSIASPGNSVA